MDRIGPSRLEHIRGRDQCLSRIQYSVDYQVIWDVLAAIRVNLKGGAMSLFQKSCFGHFLGAEKIQFQAQSYLNFLFCQDGYDTSDHVGFDINGNLQYFDPNGCCVVTRLRYG